MSQRVFLISGAPGFIWVDVVNSPTDVLNSEGEIAHYRQAYEDGTLHFPTEEAAEAALMAAKIRGDW